ncbi:MAG: hypothetical protein KAX49_04355 [Halanaerobiales bacterium]|nr:hypothetical protein [Halanaerobiales bacterium]
MKRMSILLMAVVLVFLVFSKTSANVKNDPLWQKALSIMEANQFWVAKDIYSHIEDLNRKGELENVLELYIESVIKPNGEVKIQVVKVAENSEDITSKRKNDLMELNQEALNLDGFQSNPYSEALKNNLDVKQTGQVKVIDEMNCIGYEFMITSNKKDISCIAWIEEKTGIPLQIEYYPKKSLKMLGDFQNISTYKFSADEWYIKNTVINTTINILIIKRTLIMSMDFSNYEQK